MDGLPAAHPIDDGKTISIHGEPAASRTFGVEPAAPISNRIGQYELIRALGRGGMGEVHLARDLRLGRLVAVKLFTGHHADLTQRFLAEARTTARCNHENIVVIHEIGEHDGAPYMVLEYLEGQTLRQWLREHAAAAGEQAPVPPGRAVELMLPVVRALAYAHERGIVHRDLKPENVMLTRSGAVKVLDFGIAKLLSAPRHDGEGSDGVPDSAVDAGSGGLSGPANVQCSALIGTLPYMSPEQMNQGLIDHRSDIWTVGIMLFELVTGRHPMPTCSMGELLRIADLDEPMTAVGEVMLDLGANLESEMAPLADIIDRCLLKHAEHRTPSARVLLAELEALAPGRRSVLVGDDGSPFAGLAAFQEADADRFFGRDRDIDQVVTELRSRPLLTVVGPSGAGKSSLVRAGVIPALKRSGEGWDAHVVRPGREPLVALAAMLGAITHQQSSSSDIGSSSNNTPETLVDSAASVMLGPLIERMSAEPGYLGARLRARATSKLRRIVVFVDQLEELYTLGTMPDERAAFLACLAAVADDAASPLRVILSMRSDFLDRLTEDRRLGAEVTRGLVLLPPMDPDGMRQALLQPIEAAEYRFESPALVDRMVEALAATPGALPLLQFTAARLWELRDTGRRLLTEASYERLGGVAGALATHADAVLAGMSSARQALARAVLERLVTPERTRALVSMTELRAMHRDPEAVDDVVQHLAAMRLLVIERGDEGEDHIVELVHESLIDRWPTLARWLSENQDDAAFLARLRSAAQEWERRDRDEGLLWRGATAREAHLWYAHYRGTLGRREQDYLDAVFGLESRVVRVQRRIVAGIMGLLVLLLVGASVALIQIGQAQREADQQAENARARAAEAEQAQKAAEGAQKTAERALMAAEIERTRAQQETDKARVALVRAQRSEGRSLAAEADARKSLDSARAAAEAERRMRQELQDMIARSLGHVSDSLLDPMRLGHAARAVSDEAQPWQPSDWTLPDAAQPATAEPAAAEPPWALAAALFAEGTGLFKQWRFEEAEQKLREALAHWEHPSIRLYLSRTMEKQGRLDEAHEVLQQARRSGVEQVSPEDVRVAEELQTSLESRLAQLEIRCALPGVEVFIDGVSWFKGPGRERRMLSPGQHALGARKRGYSSVTELISLNPGKQARVVLRMATTEGPWPAWSLYGVWGSAPDDIFAVGAGGKVLHHDGESWQAMTLPTEISLRGVWGSGPDDVFAVGEGGTILHHDGQSWRALTVPTAAILSGVWGSGPDDVFAVGEGGTILHYDGQSWQGMPSSTRAWLSGVWGSGPDDVFAVGEDGTILHYDGQSWRAMPSSNDAWLYGVWGSEPDDVFAVGYGGTVVHWDGQSWQGMPSFTRAKLSGVWGSGPDDVFAMGQGSTILHWDGKSWRTMESPAVAALSGVWGSGPGGVFAVGDGGMVLGYDGRFWMRMQARTIERFEVATWGSSGILISLVKISRSIVSDDPYARDPKP
jgi:serine/threonine protein kinase/tetratricopeptide (TPR) repeat protein